MSEGGIYPWKIQKINAPPHCRYSDIQNPLPPPPKGQAWMKNEETREWKLVSVAEATAAAVPTDGEEADSFPIAAVQPINNNCADTTPPPAAAAAAVGSTEEVACIAVPVINISTYRERGAIISTTTNKIHTVYNDDDEDTFQNGIHYHQVKSTDTLQGLILKYNITTLELRRANKFMGNVSLSCLVGEKLVIPPPRNGQPRIGLTARGAMTNEEKIASLLNQCCKARSSQELKQQEPLGSSEARAYLELNDWDLSRALENVKEDFGWSSSLEEQK